MGAFGESVRDVFGRVFGRADLDRALRDDFELADSLPPERGPAALHRPTGGRLAKTRPFRLDSFKPRVTDSFERRDDSYEQMLARRGNAGTTAQLPVAEGESGFWESFDSIALTADDVREPGAVPTAAVPAAPRPPLRAEAPPARAPGRDEAKVGPPPIHEPLRLSPPPASRPLRLVNAVRGSLAVPVRTPNEFWDEGAVRTAIAEALALRGDPAAVSLRAAITDSRPGTLPPLPSSAARLLGADGPPPPDEEVLALVQSDPAVAGRVIKLSNSPFYLTAMPTASLPAAVVRLGLDEVRNAVLAAAFEAGCDAPGWEAEVAALRARSLRTAWAAEVLARGCDVAPDRAFLAGLLHDAGELYVLRAVGPGADPVAAAALRREWHAMLGVLFLGGWDLDAGVAAAMAYHHDPDAAEPRFQAIARLVAAADAAVDLADGHARSARFRRALADAQDGTFVDRRRLLASDGVDALDVSPVTAVAPAHVDADLVRAAIRTVLLRGASEA